MCIDRWAVVPRLLIRLVGGLASLSWCFMGAPAQAAGQWQPLENKASCTALNTVVQPGATVTWVGACENGKATGPGVWASRYLQGGAWQDDVPHNYDGSSNAYELFTSLNMIKVYSFSTVASKVGDEFNKSVGKDVQAGNTKYLSQKKDLSIVRFKTPKFKMPKFRAPKYKAPRTLF